MRLLRCIDLRSGYHRCWLFPGHGCSPHVLWLHRPVAGCVLPRYRLRCLRLRNTLPLFYTGLWFDYGLIVRLPLIRGGSLLDLPLRLRICSPYIERIPHQTLLPGLPVTDGQRCYTRPMQLVVRSRTLRTLRSPDSLCGCSFTVVQLICLPLPVAFDLLTRSGCGFVVPTRPTYFTIAMLPLLPFVTVGYLHPTIYSFPVDSVLLRLITVPHPRSLPR